MEKSVCNKTIYSENQKRGSVSRVWVDFLINLPNINDSTGLRDRLMFEMMYGCGMRISELAMLKISDIDFENDYITFGDGNRRRTVPIYPKLKNAILKYMNTNRVKFAKNKEVEFLLLNRNGTGFTRQGLWYVMKRYFDKIPAAEGVTPNKLRQSLAVHLFESGVDRESIRKFMGYKSVYSIKRYAKAVPRRKKYVLMLKNKKTINAEDFSVHPRFDAQ